MSIITRSAGFLVCATVLGAACQSVPPFDDTTPAARKPAAKGVVAEAQREFPRIIDMHQKIVGRSCAPNAGVCHNTSNYPDMQTTGSLLALVGAWCNIAIPEPTAGFDLCERKGDYLYIEGGFTSEVAWVERVGLDLWRFGIRDPAPASSTEGRVHFYEDEDASLPVLYTAPEWGVFATLVEGADVIEVRVTALTDNPFIQDYVDVSLLSVIPGDPNQNGVFGADEHPEDERAAVLSAGSLERSYLWGRITGNVPGSRMPLANEPITDAEYVAIACFIEGLARNATPAPDDAIDYDACAFAKDPVSYEQPL